MNKNIVIKLRGIYSKLFPLKHVLPAPPREMDKERTQEIIANKIKEGKPFMLARFGSIECDVCENVKYTFYKKRSNLRFICWHGQPNFINPWVVPLFSKNAGFFPANDVSAFTTYSFKPQLRTVGPKYGKYLGKIRELLSSVDGNAAMAELKANGVLVLALGDAEAELTEEDLLIESAQKPGFASNSDHGVTVVLDTNLTPELIEEGYMRELVSKIQTMRKESGFEVMDNIRVYISGSATIKDIVRKNFDEIKGEVLAKDVVFDTEFATSKNWDLNGQQVKLGVEKL